MIKKPTGSGPQPDPQRGWRVVRSLWIAQLALLVFVWFGLPRVMQPSGGAHAPAAILPIFYLIALADLALGWWLRAQALARARQTPGSSADEMMARMAGPSMVAVTLASTPTILGLVAYLAYGDRGALNILCMLGSIDLLILRPRFE